MILEPVKEQLSDKVLDVSKNLIETFVPGGAPAVKILEALVGTPIQKRREALTHDICSAINKILDKGFVLEQLQQDEDFIEFLHQAIRIASMTAKTEKRAALKNAIYNSVTHPTPPGSDMQQIFLGYVESFNTAHLKLLHLLINPRDWFIKNRNAVPRTGIGHVLTIRDAILNAYPEFKNHNDLINSIWADLFSKDLLYDDKSILDTTPPLPSEINAMHVLFPPIDVLSTRITTLGEQFVAFISE